MFHSVGFIYAEKWIVSNVWASCECIKYICPARMLVLFFFGCRCRRRSKSSRIYDKKKFHQRLRAQKYDDNVCLYSVLFCWWWWWYCVMHIFVNNVIYIALPRQHIAHRCTHNKNHFVSLIYSIFASHFFYYRPFISYGNFVKQKKMFSLWLRWMKRNHFESIIHQLYLYIYFFGFLLLFCRGRKVIFLAFAMHEALSNGALLLVLSIHHPVSNAIFDFSGIQLSARFPQLHDFINKICNMLLRHCFRSDDGTYIYRKRGKTAPNKYSKKTPSEEKHALQHHGLACNNISLTLFLWLELVQCYFYAVRQTMRNGNHFRVIRLHFCMVSESDT